ncbi:4-hydroxythreonine-4-phosphate dehydrogenase PdxA [Actinomyces faecalis]|uniref:4-hydroxythreonine-4-phosphate dehydrogenase PdxA n=1 Tax=Actinomyces faecalis TaxID=2722820 RepID=UPI0015561375|nr:4-hydroxythreonine-4-phosphate dehydrogenase PdxA [Actinomyces faecalis]
MPSHNKIPKITITLGDFSGVGPELAVRLLSNPTNLEKAAVSIFASASEIATISDEFNVTVPIGDDPGPGHVCLLGSELADIPVAAKQTSVAAGRRVMSDLRAAVQRYRDGLSDSLMFLPLNKTSLHLAGMHEHDELRWFANLLGFDGFTSELNFVPGLTTSRVTSHIPLSEVAFGITARAVRDAITLLHRVIQGTGVPHPRIAVAALNPHAGEHGQFGREEIEHISPGIELASQVDGVNVEGPFPCDTIFIKAKKGEYDGVVTMYHDQGQIAMKLMGFDSGVTVQGGLPVPIVTPAHGTAYEIVGLGKASLGPSQRAFDIAVDLGRQHMH